MTFSPEKKIKTVLNKIKNKFKYDSVKISLIYTVIGFVLIYLSNILIKRVADNNKKHLNIVLYRQWVYVIITAIIIYFFIRNLEEKLKKQLEKIIDGKEKLRKSEEKNSAILRAIPDLLFIFDKNGDFLDTMVSDESKLYVPKDSFLGRNIREIMPSDLADLAYDKIQLVLKYGRLERFEYELQGQKFDLRLVKSNEEEVLAISRDITIEKEAEEAIKASEITFRKLFESSSDAILIIENNKVIDCNFAMVKLLGYESKEYLTNKNPSEIFLEKQPDGELSVIKMEKMYSDALKYGKCKFEWWYKSILGELLPAEVMMTTILLKGKIVFHTLWRDISDRKKMEQKLQYLSYHDQLTGIYNRRFFEEEITNIDVEDNLPLTMVMADVNGLKLINDSFGHVMGDELIKKVVKIISNGCRKNDLVARLGGDEFIVLMPNTSSEEAEQIIKEIKLLAANEKIESVEVSISFGYETKRNKNQKLAEVFKKAEDYMYNEKMIESPRMRGRTINAIISALNEKNKREEQHSIRVSKLCENVGKALRLPKNEINELKTVGLLHDIGKIAIDKSILNKPEKLTKEEFEEIKKHTEIGYRILSMVNELSHLSEYVLAHHEKWDGTGYPKGLKGEEIPFKSRIITIADSYDVMISERSYKLPMSQEAAIKELKANAGSQFDPKLVEVFIEKVLG